jgi:hypothetical protein
VEVEEMKFRLYKHRTAPRVTVPLATPEIIELNEIVTAPFSIREYYDASSPMNDRADSSNIDESITDSSKQARGEPFISFWNYNK